MEDSPAKKVTSGELFAGKKVVVFGLPGKSGKYSEGFSEMFHIE